ncbi:MAG TPA: neutral zinc metallopeptidase [Polyangiaceae bacterium]|nr:neutral zinc metallopeptidase [Polyangiaceae bacterium]
MRYTPGGPSEDIEDRRGQGGGGLGGGGLKLGLGGMLLVGLLSVVFRRNLFADLSQVQGNAPSRATPGAPYQETPQEKQMVEFVSFVLDDVQNTWTREFQARGQTYPRAKLVLFTDVVRSACGTAESATGPFYCPGDQKAYIDLSFYQDLKARFGAPGDFAQAYVLAHEIGHHVQNVLGTEKRLRREQRANPADANALSVRMELQADCYAGMWGKSTQQRNLLEEGDVDEALNCATAIGDDRLQKQAGGRVSPETFTHGSSEQRKRWFKRGFESKRLEDCDTFGTTTL